MSKGKALIGIGILYIVLSLGIVLIHVYHDFRAKENSEQALNSLMQEEQMQSRGGLLSPEREMAVVSVGDYEYIGVLSIPVLELELPVLSEWDYSNLEMAPCRYSGTAYKGNFVVAAHNYLSHFGKLARLSTGDRVTFRDNEGNVFCYEVIEKDKLGPTEVEEMVDAEYNLTLFTCTAEGTERLTVRCNKTTEISGEGN